VGVIEPANEQELLIRAQALDGISVGELAAALGFALPHDPRRSKGSVGQIAEIALGATAKSLSIPDFPALGIELKTIPLKPNGRPSESTHVCTATLAPLPGARFNDSCVFHKLSRVLWLPVEYAHERPLSERRFGPAKLWSPSVAQWQLLRADWEEIHELICCGAVHSITARFGEVLQLRPKGANARATVSAIGPRGQIVQTNPRAFYLRPTFTATIIAD
jgi:DNA mismatch repair protein MutH